MKKLLLAGGTSVAAISMISLGIAGIVMAAPSSASHTTLSKSGIPATTLKADRLQAEATILHTTTAAVQNAVKTKSLKTMLSSAGLTPKSFKKQVAQNVASELRSQGYNKYQVTIAEQKQIIHWLRDRLKHFTKHSTKSTSVSYKSSSTIAN